MEYDPLPDDDAPARRGAAARARRWSWRGVTVRVRRWPWRQAAGRIRGWPWRRIVAWGWPVAAAIVAGALGGIGFAAAIHVPRVESVAEFTPSLITQLRGVDGGVFATFALERRVMLAEGEIPPLLADAVIAVEDSNFRRHGGVDAMAILRAQAANLRAGQIEEGASTLTMQLARLLFLNPERTWRRKIEEAFLAVELEKTFSKEQILTLYLNLVNLGHGNYGMESAARYYFGKSVADLTLPEAAALAGIIQRPSDYSPYRRPEVVRQRRDKVLTRMLDEGFIDREQHRQATAAPLLVVTHAPQDRLGPYFAEEVRKHLDATYGTTLVVEGGLQVATTLDPAIQRAAEAAVRGGLVSLDHRKGWRGALTSLREDDLAGQTLPSWTGAEPEVGRWYQGIVLASAPREATVKIENRTYPLTSEGIAWTRRDRVSDVLRAGHVAWFRLEAPAAKGKRGADADPEAAAAEPLLRLEQEPQLEGAAIVLESATGAIRALVGGWDFDRNKFNRATQAHRQLGSAFKPFVFGAALEQGYTPADTLFDAPTAFLGADNQLSYLPRNYYRRYLGILTLRRALELSINVTSVKLLDLIGVDRVVDFARRCGIQSELPPYPSMALGAADVVPLEMAAAFAAVANHGTWVAPYLIERVTTADGRLLEQHQPRTHAAMEPRVAYVLTHMLEGVVDRGTAAKLAPLDLDLAGKTGTTDDYSDAWFIGFSPRYTMLTWVGYDVKKSIGRKMTGAEAALPIWKTLAEAGLADGWLAAGDRFTPPPGVALQPVEYLTGLLPGPGAERLIDEAFLDGTEPVRQYDPRWTTIMSLPWYQQRPFYIPKEGEKMPTADIQIAEAEDGEEHAGD
jgi:penicillin-binding protein 1A